MNGIKLLEPTSTIFRRVDFQDTILFMIMSSVIKRGNKLVSEYSVREIHDFFDHDDCDTMTAITTLIKTNIIKVDEGVIQVGDVTDSGFYLYANISDETDLSDAIAVLEKTMLRYIKAVRIGNKNIDKVFDSVTSKKISDYTCRDFLSLFSFAYEIYMQEPMRATIGKEAGLMKNLSQQYQPAQLFRMIVSYVIDFEIYSKKGVPNISYFFMLRDTVYANSRVKKKVEYIAEEYKGPSDEKF